jgi:hypothetical protein
MLASDDFVSGVEQDESPGAVRRLGLSDHQAFLDEPNQTKENLSDLVFFSSVRLVVQ